MNDLIYHINNDFKAFDIQEKIATVQYFFEDVAYSHFPVLEDGVFLGTISSEEIGLFDTEKTLSDYKYTLDVFFTRKNHLLLEILQEFAENDSNIMPVLDENQNYLGYYELEDIIKKFNETPFLKESGGLIVIEKKADDFAFSQIAQIVEGNNGKLLGLFISNAVANRVQITLKITSGSINEIVQTFRRYEYDIISEHQEDNYIQNLKERSEYLNKYLNI